MQNHKKRRGGFTLIEILVVLVLMAIISSISFGAFRSVSDGNKRTNCQSNLAQIYKSARLYTQDYDGRFPYLNAGITPSSPSPPADKTPPGGIGLWALYAFPKQGAANCTPAVNDYHTDLDLPVATDDTPQQLAGYVRSAKIFHCPADRFNKEIQLRTSPTTCTTSNVPTASLVVKAAGVTTSYLNPAFLSYQTRDDVGVTGAPTVAVDTFSSFRAPGLPVRQLTPYVLSMGTPNATEVVDRPTRDMTVLAWCRFHRSLDKDGNTVSGKRNFDNVLFSDGSVQSIPAVQEVTNTAGNAAECSAWQRVPREKAESMDSPASCTPSS